MIHLLTQIWKAIESVWQAGDDYFKDRPISFDIIMAFVIALGGILRAKLYTGKLYGISRESIKNATKYFVPNHIAADDSKKFKKTLLFYGSKGHKEFVKRVLRGKQQERILLVAHSGVGKSTYLANIFNYYQKRYRWRPFRPKLVFAHIHNSDFDKALTKLANKNSIILLDGLDEFVPGSGLRTSTEFWTAIINRWNYISKSLNYAKVIITVREQFLQTSKESGDFFNLNIGQQAGKHYHLQPFRGDQIEQYLQKKYKPSLSIWKKITQKLFRKKALKPLITYEQALDMVDKINGKPLKTSLSDENLLCGTPLILSFIELLSPEKLKEVANKRRELLKIPNDYHKHFVNKLDVYTAIVEKWFEREEDDTQKVDEENKQIKQDKGLGVKGGMLREHIDKSIEFCAQLAWEMAKNNQDFISQDEFTKLEKNKLKAPISRLGDRSLLKKDSVTKDVQFAHRVPPWQVFFTCHN